MIPLLYPLSFLAAVISLSLWFYFQQQKLVGRLLRIVFFLALAVYLVSLGLHTGTWAAKWSVLLRDLAIMAVAPALLSIIRNRSWIFFALLAAGVLSMALGWNRFSQKMTASVPEGEWELLLEMKEGSELAQLKKITRKFGLQYERAFAPQRAGETDLDDYYLVEIPQAKEDKLEALSAALRKNTAVDWVEMNDIVDVAPPVEIPLRKSPSKEYGVNDPGIQYLWGFDQMGVADLYKLFRETGVRPVKHTQIAILDTGVDAAHEDIKANFKSTNAKYDKDRMGHGTHCAGIAAAVSNNKVGIASFSPNAGFLTVTSVKVLGDNGSGTQAAIVRGIIEAADKGVDVISMSLGGRTGQDKQMAYQKAVEYANKAGVIVVAAAGNDGSYAKNISPANTPGIIAVSAVDTLLNRASFSNRIAGIQMAVAAPGVNIYSTFPGNKYKNLSGTSMATPYVAGLLGVMKAFKPTLTTQEAYDIMRRTGIPSGAPDETGAIIQPEKAIRELLGI